MKFEINTSMACPAEVRVGNVYAVGGGHGRGQGHLMILFAIAEPKNSYQSASGLMIIVDKHGNPRGVTSYAMHNIAERSAIAFVDGLEDLTFEIRSL